VAIVVGFFVGVTAAQITQAGIRQRGVPWSTLAGSLLGMTLGAGVGGLCVLGGIGWGAFGGIARAFGFMALTGMGGALVGGLLGAKVSNRHSGTSSGGDQG
jgi:hypothetical protein